MSKYVLYIGLALFASNVGLGAQILEVGSDGKSATITQSTDARAFLPEDYLCVLHGQAEIACGLVATTDDDEAEIKFDFVKEPLSKGDKVVYAGGRYPASTIPPVTEASVNAPLRRKKVFPFDITAGAINGQNYMMPMVHFQGMISTRTSLGIMPVIYRKPFSNPTLDSIGGLFTVNFYLFRYFRGPFVGAGAGFYAFSANGTRRTTSGVAMAQVGYRIGIFRGLNLGLSVGAQYINQPRTGANTFTFSQYQGIGIADLGWNF